MPSPFPGMNPYLEQNDAWKDFHGRFMVALAEHLDSRVGDNYVVKIEVRLYIRELSTEDRRFFGEADTGVSVTETSSFPSAGNAVAAMVAPVRLTLPDVEIVHHSLLEIRDVRDRQVVTVIELLSPSNKSPGADHLDYLAKRSSILASTTHLVEIDLRRGGLRPALPALPPCDYYVLVSRYEERPNLGMWPLGLRDRLPIIPIPLAAPDADVPLDLQELFHRVYDAAGYRKYIYADRPRPTLRAEDAEWARQFLPATP